MKAVFSSLALLFVCTGMASANITISGQGKVTYVPDLGYVSVGVSSKAKTAREAWDKNNVEVKKLFDALEAHGVAPKDMQTISVGINPEYSHPKDQDPVLIGYVVHCDLRVTVRKLDDMGAVLDDLVRSGANRNVGVGFGSSEVDKLINEARVKAAADARSRADLYATTLGSKRGRVIEISETQFILPERDQLRFELADAKSVAPALKLAQGEQAMSATVHVVFALAQE